MDSHGNSVIYCLHVLQASISVTIVEEKMVTFSDKIEPRHKISNNVVCATSKDSDQPAHTRSLIRAFASRLNIL